MEHENKMITPDILENAINQIADEALVMLATLGRAGAGTSARNVVKRLLGRAVPKKDPIFWPAGILLLGLVEAGRSDAEALQRYVNSWLEIGSPVVYTDDALFGHVLTKLQIRDCNHDSAILEKRWLHEALEHVADFLMHTPKDAAGSIIYHPEMGNKLIYADGAGMTAMFLSAYAATDTETARAAMDLAVTQLLNFQENALDSESGLPYHAYDLDRQMAHGIIGWGRAVGWLMMGMSECLLHLPDDHASYHKLVEVYADLIDNCLSYQRSDGGFSWMLPASQGEGDTSASAMIGYAICKSIKSGLLDNNCIPNLTKLTSYLLSHTEDGKVMACSGECVDFAMYSHTYAQYPWGQGAALAFLSQMKDILT